MRTIYGPDLILMFFPDVEMSIDVLEAEEVAFILVTNKNTRERAKFLSFLLCISLTLEVRYYLFHMLSLFLKL